MKSGHMASIAPSKCTLSRESWEYFAKQVSILGDAIKQSTCKRRFKQRITHADLSLVASILNTTKQVLAAASFDGYKAFMTLFSALIDLRIKKCHPSIHVINDTSRNPLTLQSTDTINMGDIDLHNVIGSDMSDWFDPLGITFEYLNPE